MKTIIIEDEKAAVRNLKALLQEVNPGIEVETSLDSIASSLDWFATHPMPDLLFMDIHLADGSAFEIFPGYQMYTCWMIRHLDGNPWLQTDRCEDERYVWLHDAQF